MIWQSTNADVGGLATGDQHATAGHITPAAGYEELLIERIARNEGIVEVVVAGDHRPYGQTINEHSWVILRRTAIDVLGVGWDAGR